MPISFYWEKTPDYDISTKNSYHRHGVLNEVVIPYYTCLFSSFFRPSPCNQNMLFDRYYRLHSILFKY